MRYAFRKGQNICGRLIIKAVKRRYGKERRYLIRHLYARCVGFYSPIISVITIVRSDNDVIAQEIIEPYAYRKFKTGRWQAFNRVLAIVKIYPVKWQT